MHFSRRRVCLSHGRPSCSNNVSCSLHPVSSLFLFSSVALALPRLLFDSKHDYDFMVHFHNPLAHRHHRLLPPQRNLLLEQNTRQGIQDMVKEQERRLQRQLNAAKRRQADAAAAAAMAGVATTTTSRVALSPYDPNARQARIELAVDAANVDPSARRVERANEVRLRRARLQAEQERKKVEALQRKGELRAQAFRHKSGIVKSGQWDGGASKGHGGGGAAAAAATVSAGAVADGGSGGGALRQAAGKGVIIGSGPPRCTMKSWSEQVR